MKAKDEGSALMYVPSLAPLPPSLSTDKREDYDEPSCALIDTLFSLAEAYLYMQVRTGPSGGGVGGWWGGSSGGDACSVACYDCWRTPSPACHLPDSLLSPPSPVLQLVEMKDSSSSASASGNGAGAGAPLFSWASKSYADLYRDVRGAVDLCHRDGSIKREVAANPEK